MAAKGLRGWCLVLSAVWLSSLASAENALGEGDLTPQNSPWGIVLGGKGLADPDIQNKSVSEKVLKIWKKQVKKSAKDAMKEIQEEIISDDPEYGRDTATAKEVADVVTKARSLAVPAGDISAGGKETAGAERRAQNQAEAAAFMAAQEAAITDAYDVPTVSTINPYPHARAPPGRQVPKMRRIVHHFSPSAPTHRALAADGAKHMETLRKAASSGAPPVKRELSAFGAERFTVLDQLGGGYDKSAKALWDPVMQGAANEADTQALIHDVQHNFMAQGDPSGKAGKGFTGVEENGPVWHADWSASDDGDGWTAGSSPTKSSSWASSGSASGSTSPAPVVSNTLSPQASGAVGSAAAQGTATTLPASDCKPSMLDSCRGECNSKENLEIEDSSDSSKSFNLCMQTCLGVCSKGLGYGESPAEEIADNFMTAESVASAAIKHLEAKFSQKQGGAPSVSLDPEDDSQPSPPPPAQSQNRPISASSGSTGVWRQSGGGVASATTTRPLPVENQGKSGARTGVYDCRGQPIRVGNVVGRMVPGQPCEDRILLLTAGKWQVTDYKKPGSLELAQVGQDKQGRVGVVLDGVSPGVNMQHQVEIVPVRGSFVSWKIIQGPTDDLYMPENVQRLTSAGKANIAGTASGPQYVAALLGPVQTHKKSTPGASKVESIEAAKVSDWSRTDLTEKEDKNLDMCPGPSCPQMGVSHKRKIMSLGDPIWKYIVCAILVGMFLALRYIRKAGDGGQEQYVQLPDMFGKFDVVVGEAKKGKEGGARPCPGMKAGERIVMVENASDRVVMVDVVGQQVGAEAASNRDTASDDVGYQG